MSLIRKLVECIPHSLSQAGASGSMIAGIFSPNEPSRHILGAGIPEEESRAN
jgi:hypothetical protein